MNNSAETVARDVFAAIDNSDWDGLSALLHEDHQFHFPLAPQPLNRDAHCAMTREFSASFSDFTHHIDELLVIGDKAVTRGAISVRHTGEYQGIPATGNKVRFGFINIMRVADGKNREEWAELNMVALMQGIGALPG